MNQCSGVLGVNAKRNKEKSKGQAISELSFPKPTKSLFVKKRFSAVAPKESRTKQKAQCHTNKQLFIFQYNKVFCF